MNLKKQKLVKGINVIKIYKNGYDITAKRLIFSGGEVQSKVEWGIGDTDESGLVTKHFNMRADVRSSDDLMELLMVTDALSEMYGGATIDLELPYVPYARQDRVCDYGEALSIRVLCKLINSQNYNSVKIWDPHSDVTPALLDRVRIVKPAYFLRKLPAEAFDKDTVFVSPDAGANKKVFQAASELHINEVVRADKTRNVSTGALSGTVVYGDVAGKDVMIVDDIFDRGGTFILLGNELKRMGAKKVSLYVTHGIFALGVDVLIGSVDKVYCPNIWVNNVIGRDSTNILQSIKL